MPKLPFPEGCPVQVVLSIREWLLFDNLIEAKKIFPDLDPDINGKNFTWAMYDKVNGKTAMRFESWEAYERFSA